jgi:hypothetical protein
MEVGGWVGESVSCAGSGRARVVSGRGLWDDGATRQRIVWFQAEDY